jgi:ubiquitin C-terminal hydrolase
MKIGVCRFKNINGVSCYMNSILHILQQIPLFTDYILNANNTNNISTQLYNLLKLSLENDNKTIIPIMFKNTIEMSNNIFNDNEQQDSHEFLLYLISEIKTEYSSKHIFIPNLTFTDNNNLSVYNSLYNIISHHYEIMYKTFEYSNFSNIFDGLLEYNKVCQICGSKSINFNSYIILELELPNENNLDIYDLLDYMIKEENVEYKCEFCGTQLLTYSNILLWKTPKILIIKFQRFDKNNNKINTNITYPVQLNLSKYYNSISPYKFNCNYNLIGINMHTSNETKSGHYTSIIKNKINNNWYFYNDSAPIELISKLQQSNAYMLFYMLEL